MAPPDTALELARRAVARILYNETPFRNDDNNVTFVLADIMALVILKTLRLASSYSMLANRPQLNIFDVLKVMPLLNIDAKQLLEFLTPRQIPQKPTTRPLIVVPSGRSLLRALGDDDDEEELADLGPRPNYLTDIYPPFPRPYTFRRTETRGIRESDKVLIAKAKAEQQRQVESNLYRLLAKTNSLPEVINYGEDY